jgi:DNA uptake protein ComE-like DNA-binding protein
MSIKVPNYCITIHNSKGTSRQRIVPQYELPLIQALWASSAPGGQSPHISCDPVGASAHLKNVRYTEVESLAAEKKRLQIFYEKNPTTKAPIFGIVYPLNTFEETVKKVYPNLFGESELFASLQVHVDEPTPVEEVPVDIDDAIIDELSQLKKVGVAKAKALAAAGFTSISEIAQTDPVELQVVKGISAKEAVEIVEHAVELSLGDEAEAFSKE